MLDRRLVQASYVACVVYAVPHFIFHLTTSELFSLGYNMANIGILGLAVLLPLVLLVLSGPYGVLRKQTADEALRR